MVTPEAFISPVPVRADLRDAIIAVLQVSLPNWTPQQSDPGYYIADDIAERIIRFIEQHNAGAAELYPLTASVEGLIQLLDNIGVPEATGTITELLQQYRNRWNALAASTTEFVQRLVQSINNDIISIEVARDIPRSKAIVFAVKADGVALTPIERQALDDELNNDFTVATKVLWWDYVVLDALHIPYTVEAQIRYRQELISLADLKVLINETLTTAMNSLAKLDRALGESILEQAIYGLNTEAISIIQFVAVTLVPTIGALPSNWFIDPEAYSVWIGNRLKESTSTLDAAVLAIRADEPGDEPARFVTNAFRPTNGTLIEIDHQSIWDIKGRIFGVTPTTKVGEEGFVFQIKDPVTTGMYLSVTTGVSFYRLGPTPYYYFEEQSAIIGHYMQSNLGIVYGPGTFDGDTDITYISHVA